MAVTEQMSQALSIAGTPVYPQTLNNSSQQTGSVNMTKFERVMFLVNVGALSGSASVTAQLQYSPDNISWTNLGGAVISGVTASSKTVTLEVRAGQLGLGNLYVRCNLSETAGYNAVCSCTPLAGEAHQEPGAAQDVSSVQQRLVM